MARRGRPTVEIKLSGEERQTLERWTRRHSSSQALALRSRIVLGCGEGRTDVDIASELGVHPVTLSNWRHRFAADRLDGLVDALRPGAARTIGDDMIEAIVSRRSRPHGTTRRTGPLEAWPKSTDLAYHHWGDLARVRAETEA